MRCEFAIRAELLDGEEITLRRGFVSYEAAEDYPVVARKYRRIWVEQVATRNLSLRFRTVRQPAVTSDEAFAVLEHAAATGERCPMNKTRGFWKTMISSLAHAGKIRIEVFSRNWRVVTILEGPQRGKATAAPPFKTNGPYLTIDAEGRKRHGWPV